MKSDRIRIIGEAELKSGDKMRNLFKFQLSMSEVTVVSWMFGRSRAGKACCLDPHTFSSSKDTISLRCAIKAQTQGDPLHVGPIDLMKTQKSNN